MLKSVSSWKRSPRGRPSHASSPPETEDGVTVSSQALRVLADIRTCPRERAVREVLIKQCTGVLQQQFHLDGRRARAGSWNQRTQRPQQVALLQSVKRPSQPELPRFRRHLGKFGAKPRLKLQARGSRHKPYTEHCGEHGHGERYAMRGCMRPVPHNGWQSAHWALALLPGLLSRSAVRRVHRGAACVPGKVPQQDDPN